MKRGIFCGLFVSCLVTLCTPFLSFAGEVPPEIRSAADTGINTFFKDPRMGGLQQLGFQSKSDMASAVLGEGFHIFTVHPDKILDESGSYDFQSLLTPTNQWQFLVFSGTEPKLLLTVDIMDGAWTPVSLGSAGLAKELGILLAAWPASSGYRYRLVRVYQAKADFIEVSKEDSVIGIVPMGSSNAAMGTPKVFDPMDLRDLQDVVSNLRQAVQRNIEAGQ